MGNANSVKRFYWQPISLNQLLSNYEITSRKVLGPIIGWCVLIVFFITLSSQLLPLQWISPLMEDVEFRSFFMVYPAFIVGLLLLFWFGFEWGFIPLFISSFALAFNSGISVTISIIFGLSFIFGLALIGLAYYSLRIPHDLRGFKSIAFFVSISFIASLASSISALIWGLSLELSAFETANLWKFWWTGVFFQSLIITGPLLYLFTPRVESFKEKYYQVEPTQNISMKWIYGTVISVTLALTLFIFSGQLLGKYRLSEVLGKLPNIVQGDVFGALDSFEIIFWISIGLVLVTGYTAIYLVGEWNQQLKREVQERTRQLREKEQQLRNLLEEKQLMLKETHHRVKNNLAQVNALLQLQMFSVEDEKYTRLIKDATTRIHSMSLIHRVLYETEEFTSISLGTYLKKLCSNIDESFNIAHTDVSLKFDVDNYSVDAHQAVLLGLTVTEIMINAYKYAFEDRAKGTIWISLKEKGEKLLICIEDNGIGMPEDSPDKKATLGMKLIKKLSHQLKGDISIESNSKGTRFSLLFTPKK